MVSSQELIYLSHSFVNWGSTTTTRTKQSLIVDSKVEVHILLQVPPPAEVFM